MNINQIAKRSLRTLWGQKHLWFFGFFVAAASGGGGGGGGGGGTGGPIPAWLIPVAIGLGVVGIAAAIMNVLSEAALIRGVRDDQDGETLGIVDSLRASRPHFWTVLALKALLAAGFVVTALLVATPLALGAFEVLPLWVGFLIAAPLLLVSIPVVLTLYFVYEYALRFAVLDDLGARDALSASRRFLHGRLADSIRLTLLSFAGQIGGSLVGFVGVVPGALLGLGAYFLFGTVPAVVVAALLALPVMLAVQGAIGTFRSSVWTLGFMEARG